MTSPESPERPASPTSPKNPESPESPAKPGSPAAIEADIERQREQLAATVDALHARLDVKTRAKHKVAELKDRATTDTGAPRPELVAGAAAAVLALTAVVWWRRTH